MATFVLIHGGGGSGWDWHLVAPELRGRGHDVVATDLPTEDESAGLTQYADTVIGAIGDRTDLIVVAHSFGGFTAPLVCARVPVELLVLVAGMVPSPGEPPGEWWANTGHEKARREQGEDDTIVATYFHDVPPALAAEAMARERRSADRPMRDPWPLEAWPDVPTKYLLCRDDRYLPAEWTRRLVRDRLGIVPEEIDGGHCPFFARPVELADRLEAYGADRHAA